MINIKLDDKAKNVISKTANMGEGGTTVIANPELSGDEAELTGLQVGETKYKAPQGGGGGETYTAGEGIDISENNEISADTTFVQPKLTKGFGININDQNVISADTTFVQPRLIKGQGIKINDQNVIYADTTVVQPRLIKGQGIKINDQNEISVDTFVVQPRLVQDSGIKIDSQNKISVDGSIQRSLNVGLGLFINNNTLSMNWNIIQKKIVPDYGVMIKDDYLLSTKPTAIMIPETAVTYEALGLDTSAQYVLNFSGLSWCLYRMGVDTDASFVREDEEESVISIGASHLSGSGAPALVYIRCINSGGGSDIQVNIECFGDSLHPNTLIYLPSAEYTIGNLLEKLQNYFDNEGKYMLSLKTLDYPSTLNNLYTNEIIITRKTIADHEYHLIDDVREFINTIVDTEGSGSSN